MFDTSVKIPMIISKSGEFPQGGVKEDLLSHYNLKPAIFDYLGFDPAADHLPGSSFLPSLNGEKFEGNNQVVIFDEYGPVRMIRTDMWKYVHRFPDGSHELYDLINDPSESQNLVGEPQWQEIRQSLENELMAWFEKYADPQNDGHQASVFGRG